MNCADNIKLLLVANFGAKKAEEIRHYALNSHSFELLELAVEELMRQTLSGLCSDFVDYESLNLGARNEFFVDQTKED